MHVLVVEDEPRMAAVVARSLREEGYQVDTAHDGHEGLALVSSTSYDAIVLDLMLPGLDGLGVCRTLRRHGHTTPILMLTARTSVEDRIRGLDAGADDYLPKPFNLGELAARLRALIRRGSADAAVMLEAGTLRLDPQGHRVWRATTLIELTAKEFSLLELLMRHPGQVLRRERILANVWQLEDSDPASNVVDQYVGYLRRKVDRPFGVTQLDTVRGVGYRLRAEPVASSRPAAEG